MKRRSHSHTAGARARRLLHILLLVLAVLRMTPASETRAQAAAPPYDHPLFTGPVHEVPEPGFDQQHLRLALRLDLARRRVFGDATLRLAPLNTALDTLVLFASGLAIDSVQVGAVDSTRAAAAYRLGGADSLLIALHLLPDPAAPFEVRIVYSARPQRGLYFVQPGKDHPAQKRQVWTQGEPEDNRHWFPVIDLPGDKLTSEILVTADSSLRVLSNGRLVDRRASGDGQATTHYIQDRPHAPYLVMLAAGDYEVVREQVRLASGRSPVPLSYWVYPERIGDVARTFGRTPDMVRFFSQTLGFPFPWDGYAQVVLRQFPFGGMENTGATTLNDRVLIDERAALDEDPDGLLAHELAHQWFGNLVTSRYWADIWLNEGFATYLSALFEEVSAGKDAFSLSMLGLADVYLAEAGVYRRPLVWNRWEDPMQMFDAHSYRKGAWVLHMLRRRLGDDVFRNVLARYLAEYAFKPVATVDFKRVLEAVAEQDFDAFFAQWVEAAGHPVLEISYDFDDDGRTLTFTVAQVQEGPRVPGVFQMDLSVDVFTLTETHRFQLPIDGRTQTLTFPFSSPPRFVVVDPDQEVLAEVRLDQSVRGWVGQLRSAPNAACRLLAARALADFIDDPALVIALRNALEQEPSPAVRVAIVKTVSLLPASPAIERTLREAIVDVDPSVREAVLDALGTYRDVPAVRDLAFTAAQNDRSYRVQAAAVKTLARTGSADALDVVRSALVTPSHRDVIRQAAFAALALLDPPARVGLDLALPYTAADQSTEVRAGAATYLQTLGRDARTALDRLIDLLDDDDVRVRQAAISALGTVGTAPARQALTRRLETEPQPLLKEALKRALRQAAATSR